MGVVDGRPNAVEIAIEQVDMDAAHHQPAATVDPRPPTTDGRDGCLDAAIVEDGSDLAQRRNVDRTVGAIVEADIVVGRRYRHAAGARAAQRDRLNAGHG
ncbi:MAG TPA: hypothetical protein VK552_11660 [Reyranella sp.]|nr:hypothetical protein [Reyranella sp.]